MYKENYGLVNKRRMIKKELLSEMHIIKMHDKLTISSFATCPQFRLIGRKVISISGMDDSLKSY
jgi:hypothetical protein